MKTNIPEHYRVVTHEGGRAEAHQSAKTQLTRLVANCLLFEDTFYESGSSIAERLVALCGQVEPDDLEHLATWARTELKLRHVPLLLLVQLLKKRSGSGTARTIEAVVQRPDEMGELLALYWKEGRRPLAAQLKKGLAAAFPKFNAYQLAKWDRAAKVKLRDVLFLVHPKPEDAEQAALWKQLIDGTLQSPDTWEVALSAGRDKRETWTRLLTERKLGYLALLMNLRNMSVAGVNPALVEQAIREGAAHSKALPFRFIAAAKHAPEYEQALSDAMDLAVEGSLAGRTVVLLDVSSSMTARLSAKGQTERWEAAAALAVLVRGMSESCRVFVYNRSVREIDAVPGLGLVREIVRHVGGSTYTEAAVEHVNRVVPEMDRLVLLTDEQADDGLTTAKASRAYLINVAPYEYGLETYGQWVRINGWSDRVAQWIQRHEQETGG